MNIRNAMQLSGIIPLLLAISACGTGSEGTTQLPSTRTHPDFTGTYDVSTLTPLTRPKEFGDNLELTPEQANAIVEKNRQRVADRTQNLTRNQCPTGRWGATDRHR